MRSLAVLAACCSLFACEGIIGANFDHGAGDGGDGAGGGAQNGDGAAAGADGALADGATSKDGGAKIDSAIQVPVDGGTFEAAQAALQMLRFPGPTTAQGSTGFCTDSRFIWRESDGTLHSWAAADQSRIDYAFKAPQTPAFFPGDVFIPVDKSDFSSILVFDTTMANNQVTSLPYSYATAGASDGVILANQVGVPATGTQVKKWTAAMGTTANVGAVLSALQPPDSFGQDELVIPASVNVPFPLYIVNVKTAVTTSVTFDGAIAKYQTLSTPLGLVVSYARSGPTPEIRLYQGNQDATRVEIGDELANTPSIYSDSPANEHKFLAHLALDKNNLIYASAFGIFGYSMDHATLAALQLGVNKAVFVPDVLCVIPSARLLMYRVQGDSVGQVWALPLASLLP